MDGDSHITWRRDPGGRLTAWIDRIGNVWYNPGVTDTKVSDPKAESPAF